MGKENSFINIGNSYFGRPNPIWAHEPDPLPDSTKRFQDMKRRRREEAEQRLKKDSFYNKKPHTNSHEKKVTPRTPHVPIARSEPVKTPQEAAEAHNNVTNYYAGRRKPADLETINEHRRTLGLPKTTDKEIEQHKTRRDAETGGFKHTRWT
jgi:hypothetical protein